MFERVEARSRGLGLYAIAQEDLRMSAPESDSNAKRNLLVNGDPQAVDAPYRVTTLLETLELGGKRVAVAVNRKVIARSHYGEIELAEGDRIEILEAVGGG